MASSPLLLQLSTSGSLFRRSPTLPRALYHPAPCKPHLRQPTLPSQSLLLRSPLAVCPTLLGRISVSLTCASSVAPASTTVSDPGPKLSSDKVSAVLFDMDGVLCNSEERSRLAGVDLFAEMGVQVTEADFFPFMGTGEANFLGGVAKVYGMKDFDVSSAKSRFFQIYLEKYAKPNSGLGFPGALDLIMECKAAGLKVALASSADRLKIDANLAAAGLPFSM
ncbi:hypothetical protein L7F22_026705 [Adiantum nelumboides]|nr:hypothetical protein [Adiantum nelumboides]